MDGLVMVNTDPIHKPLDDQIIFKGFDRETAKCCLCHIANARFGFSPGILYHVSVHSHTVSTQNYSISFFMRGTSLTSNGVDCSWVVINLDFGPLWISPAHVQCECSWLDTDERR